MRVKKKMDEKILTIDVSAKSIKVGLINASNLETEAWTSNDHVIVDEDMDGFAKHFDMDDLWKKLPKPLALSNKITYSKIDLSIKNPR